MLSFQFFLLLARLTCGKVVRRGRTWASAPVTPVSAEATAVVPEQRAAAEPEAVADMLEEPPVDLAIETDEAPGYVQLLPSPPTDAEKYSYTRRSRWLVPVQWASFAGVSFSLVRMCMNSWALLPLLVAFLFTALYFVLGQISGTAGKGRFHAAAHERTVRDWTPAQYPSVDVFLPNFGEDIAVLENTWRYVSRLEYPGEVTVYCLDDAGRPEVAALADLFGFRYLARPTHEFKKAGNLRYGFQRSSGDFLVIFDADFAPRPDFLSSLLPYTEDKSVGIVQSPQYFGVRKEQNWLERGAGAVQEFFYRHVQPGRSAIGAPICVGTNAVYRRSALTQVGGTALVEHSEDVHTGLALMEAGYTVRYIPLPLAKGLCPAGLVAFFNQQYRWCAGSMMLLSSKRFWSSTMTVRQRACFLSGFVYYLHTALWTFIAPMPAVLMIWKFPHLIALRNYIPLIPAVITTWLVFPRWHRIGYPRLASERIRIVYGYAHFFAVWDALLGRTQEWAVTGAAVRRPGRYRDFRRIHTTWTLVLSASVLGGVALRISEGYDPVAFAPLSAFGALVLFQGIRVRWAPGARLPKPARVATAPQQPESAGLIPAQRRAAKHAIRQAQPA